MTLWVITGHWDSKFRSFASPAASPLLGKFDAEFASHSSTYAGTGTVRYTW
jgi:hypothetical protein